MSKLPELVAEFNEITKKVGTVKEKAKKAVAVLRECGLQGRELKVRAREIRNEISDIKVSEEIAKAEKLAAEIKAAKGKVAKEKAEKRKKQDAIDADNKKKTEKTEKAK